MSNNPQNVKVFGKCCHIESGDRCGCQRFIALENDEKNCEACYHHSSYHEDIKENDINRSNNRKRISTLDELYSPCNNPNISSSQETGNSLLNQLLSGRALEEQSIASELSRTFSRNQNQNRLTTSSSSIGGLATDFDPFLGASNYRSSKNKKRKNIEKVKEMCITIIVLPNIGVELQTPMISQPM